MRRKRRRLVHYLASTLPDRTVIAACPIRRPSPTVMRRDHLRVDDDGVTRDNSHAHWEISDPRNEERLRFQNIIAANLNTRRALREMVLPQLEALATEVAALRAEVARLNGARPAKAVR